MTSIVGWIQWKGERTLSGAIGYSRNELRKILPHEARLQNWSLQLRLFKVGAFLVSTLTNIRKKKEWHRNEHPIGFRPWITLVSVGSHALHEVGPEITRFHPIRSHIIISPHKISYSCKITLPAWRLYYPLSSSWKFSLDGSGLLIHFHPLNGLVGHSPNWRSLLQNDRISHIWYLLVKLTHTFSTRIAT